MAAAFTAPRPSMRLRTSLANCSASVMVDFLDGLLGIADGIDQVLALRPEEVVTLLGLLILFHGGRIHRAQAFDAIAHVVGELLGLGDGRFPGWPSRYRGWNRSGPGAAP